MKALIIAPLAALVLSAVPVPAHASGSANDYIRYQQATDPGYNGRSNGYHGSSSRYDYYEPLPCFLMFCAFDSSKRKPKDGEVWLFPDCSTRFWDKKKREWKPITSATGNDCSNNAGPLR